MGARSRPSQEERSEDPTELMFGVGAACVTLTSGTILSNPWLAVTKCELSQTEQPASE